MTINEKIVSNILQREGGFVAHPSDPGGPTNFGITQNTLGRFLGRFATVDDIRNLTEQMARAIYMKNYIVEPNLDEIDPVDLRDLVVDCAVNHGVTTAVKWLQTAINEQITKWGMTLLVVDGSLGPKTKKALSYVNKDRLFEQIIARRIEFYCQLVKDDLNKIVFLMGWIKRALSFLGRDREIWIL
jgi:Putative secretion activating protein